MTCLVPLSLLFFISTAGLHAADTAPEEKTDYTHKERKLSRLEKETFDRLKKQFPRELLNPQLETLRELADSDEYVNFLSQKYPKLAPFTTFHDVFYKVLPSKELYFNIFFNKHLQIQKIEEVTDDDLFIAYAYTAGHWKYSARKKGMQIGGHRNRPRDGERVLTTPKGRKMMEHRLGMDATENLDWRIALTAFQALIPFSAKLLEADLHWIKSLFEKHGESDAILRIAVQDPMLLDRILYTFSTDEPFKKWIYNPVNTDAEFRKRAEQKEKDPGP